MNKQTQEPELLPAERQAHFDPSAQTAVAVREAQPMAVAPMINPGEMMQKMIAAGITQENVAAFTELVKLSEHVEDRNAVKAFNRAFIQLQKDIPKVKATKTIPDRNGNVRSTFAPFEEIDAQVKPLCLQHGFTYSFSEPEANQPGKITKVCTLEHEEGHKRTNAYTVRIGQGPPGCSESQADGAAHSYAKRGALCDCLNIVVTGLDNDARMEGGAVSPEQADELERRVKMVNADVSKFLKFAGNAKSFKEIPAIMYPLLDTFLKGKEKGA